MLEYIVAILAGFIGGGITVGAYISRYGELSNSIWRYEKRCENYESELKHLKERINDDNRALAFYAKRGADNPKAGQRRGGRGK